MIHPDFDNLTKNVQDKLFRIQSEYHYRTMEEHSDGSCGKIEITPKQLLIALAKAHLLEKD